MEEVKVPEGKPIRLLEWLVKVGDWVKYGTALIVYRHIEDPSTGVKTKELQLKSKHVGCVKKLSLEIGQVATPGRILMELESCQHPVVMKDMCAECGQDLRLLKEGRVDNCARVAMVPNIPELKISNQQAEELGKQDQNRLHKLRKLVLLVDLDQTLIHTTQLQSFASMCQNDKNFYAYHLSKNEPTLYTKLRPHCREFMETISKKFELQIVTFGSRQYAHKIAEFIDPEKKYFAHRILSRDECINPMRKSGNLRHLFPCGDSMVCIIDDRDDVWNVAPNLILVKKYTYFPGTGDINNPDKIVSKKGSGDASQTKQQNDQKQLLRKRKTNCNQSNEERSCKLSKPDECKTEEIPVSDNSVTTSENSIATNNENAVTASNDVDCAASTFLNETGAISSESSEHKLDLDSSSTDLDQSSLDNSFSSSHDKESMYAESVENQIENSHKSLPSTLTNKETPNLNSDTVNSQSINEISIENHQSDKAHETQSTEVETTSDSGAGDEKTNEPLPDNDDYLLYLQHILTEIHSTYYEAYDKHLKGEFKHPPDLREIVPFIRSKVLYGCHIVFTGIVPNNYKASPEQHKAHIAARQLGASIQSNVNKQTTHLVGGKKGTAKYQEAQRLGTVKFVSVDWLYACSERWERVSEKLFPIPKNRPSNNCSSREGTPPISKTVKWVGDSMTRTYNAVTGKLVKKSKENRLESEVTKLSCPLDKQQPIALYSSLEDPEVVVPLKVEIASNEPGTSAAAVRTRKPSMAEMMGIEYSLSSNDISEMGKEVDDLLSSDEDSNENNLGSLIDNTASSSSDASSQQSLNGEDKNKDTKSDAEESSSSEEEFDHMAEMLDHEMHYDENSDLDALD